MTNKVNFANSFIMKTTDLFISLKSTTLISTLLLLHYPLFCSIKYTAELLGKFLCRDVFTQIALNSQSA